MSLRRFANAALMYSAAIASFPGWVCAAAEGEAALAKLEEGWRSQRSALISVRIEAHCFAQGADGVRRLAEAGVTELIQGYDRHPSTEERVEWLIRSVRSPNLEGKPLWGEVSFVSDGVRRKMDGSFTASVGEDAVVMLANANRQASVYSPGDSGVSILSLSDFLREFDPHNVSDLRLRSYNDRDVTCVRAPKPTVEIEIVAERASGLIRRVRSTVKGALVSTVHQLGTLQVESAVLPEVVMECGYNQGRVTSISINAPVTVRVGETLTEKDFAIPLPPGGLAMDYRARGRNEAPAPLRVSEATEDVLAALEERTYPVTRSPAPLWLFVLFVAVPLVLGCGWLAMRRR